MSGEGLLDDTHATISRRCRDAKPREDAKRADLELRLGGEPVHGPVVLAANEMQRAAVQPGDEQRLVLRQRPVDVSSRQARRPGADGQPGTARILTLDREKPL